MKVTKKIILSAISKLVIGYKENTLSHNCGACPLCLIYRKHDCSKNCPNNVFDEREGENYQCVDRVWKYDNLNWSNNFNKLSEYWQDVFNMLEKETPKDVINLKPNVRVKILEIVKKYE